MRRKPKPNQLAYVWNDKERDYSIFFPSKPDGHLLYGFFAGYHQGSVPEFLKELERRGYDLKTLRFEITRKPPDAGPAGDIAPCGNLV